MARIRSKFEKELKEKLSQKTPGNLSEETFLLKTFRFFDLDNSKTVSKQEWVRAIEKIGVIVDDPQQLDELFDIYDESKDGFLDYREFIASIFGPDSSVGKQISPQKVLRPSEQQRAEELLEAIREKLITRGSRGLLGLARQFKIMDDNDSGTLELEEFVKAFRDYRVSMSEEDAQLLFSYIDRDNNNTIDYNEFLRALSGPINPFRKSLVIQAFKKLDLDGSGAIDINDIRQLYDAKNHPEVRAGRKNEDEVLNEFLDTFEMHHNMGASRDGTVTYEEFEEYYNNISAGIDNDQYFEAMMNSTWKLTPPPEYTKNKAWSSQQEEYSKPTNRAPKPELTQRRPPGAEASLDRLRKKLASRGARGILGLARQFKIMDDDGSRSLSLNEFKKACRDYRVGIDENDVEIAFAAIDRDRSGEIDYDELLRAIRGPMNQFRRNLVEQAYNKLDRDKNGLLEIEDIRNVYSASRHPDVRSGKKSEEEVLGEFLETFEMHHNISDLSRRDRKITKEEFMEYYNNVSSSIDEDAYFELMMNNAWRLKDQGPIKEAWSNVTNTSHHRQQWLADHHRSQFGGSVSSTAPFGTSDEPMDWSTTLRPARNEDVDLISIAANIPAAGAPTWSITSPSNSTNQPPQNEAPEELLNELREKLANRGARGFVGLSRQFKIMDDDKSKSLDRNEFVKALRDFRLDVTEENARKLFRYFDVDGTGTIDYEEFVHRLRGEMSNARKQMVLQAFNKLDKTGDGFITVEDLKGVYSSASHPDVRMGKKTEDEVLCEFLDTFEIHHSLYKGGKRDAKVTKDEFLEYYAHISASIDDDRYFELMLRNAWNFDNRTQQKAWRGEY
ncbi:unnamed protein product [Blepharisma stoltei]|uniref:EF-hand domain-containing protein n=1 Tax=Blepharisma stoltei TaxID=1481888 RepID=A0AAU9JYS6_9CILI|nr:unnamed protein product [Blepharisma stoltei]